MQKQIDLFDDWLAAQTPAPAIGKPRFRLAQSLADHLNAGGEITSRFLTEEANRIFGGTQAQGRYSSKDAYDAVEVAFNLHLTHTESGDWNTQDASDAKQKVLELTLRIQKLPTQTRRDPEMDEFQQFSTPPALSFLANWVAKVQPSDVFAEPNAGTGDLAVWAHIAGATVVLNELAPRRHELLAELFPDARLFRENAEQLDNVLPRDVKPTVIVMNPPFSSSAGRVRGQRDTMNGAKHIEQALFRLEDAGRLVAIVGNGMAADRPGFMAWWREIENKYTVRANVGISGREYAKYGTTFDNQIVVIDKVGRTRAPVLTSRVESVAELPFLLESVRHERQPTQQRGVESSSRQHTRPAQDSLSFGDGTGSAGASSGSSRPESAEHGSDGRTITPDRQTGNESGSGDEPHDRIRTGDGHSSATAADSGPSSSRDPGGDHVVAGGVVIEATAAAPAEFTDAVFVGYAPQRLTVPNAKKHPGKLVQSAAMSAVEPPAPTYTPALPAAVVDRGLLSIAQLEAVVYAGQAHSEELPSGARRGFFIGDGTGVGKGREISGIILDNFAQGRTKAVWISFNEGLLNDAQRDYASVGGDPAKLFFQGKAKAASSITQDTGILFTTYSTLRGGEKKQANDFGQAPGKTRLQQIVEWLGKDFDGVIAFDEAHSMGNAIELKAVRGVRKPSQQAIAGINLQRELPKARVVYVSATGATELSNLSYAERLGLWGENTPFPDAKSFINEVSGGGIAAMELISRDMKALGMYLARSLSYAGVSYERLEHALTPLQEDIYDELAGAWQIVLNNVDEALEITQAGKNGNAKSAAMAQFWGAHQRFFNQIITALQTPTVIDHMRDQLAQGHVAVIQLVNTNEAAQERIIADAAARDVALEELDFTPRQMLTDYVRHGFPVAVFEEVQSADGQKSFQPAADSEGRPVIDRQAVALRDALLRNLEAIRVPENPLDSIINAFGSDVVAEVTGRSRRFIQARDEDGSLRVIEERRGRHAAQRDAMLFQNDEKKILVFSAAGGTGYSFHADNQARNKHKRIHYVLQPGWRADSAVQGFGRTHRTDQASEPHYVLPTTNLKAQKRFVSSIARRLDQLGALTRGQRQATSQGMFTAADNLESEYAKIGLYNFFIDLKRGATPLSFEHVTRSMGLKLVDQNGAFSETKIPDIPQFLNRLLSLKADEQNGVFAEFEKRLIEAVEHAKQHGLFDQGLQTLSALNIKKTRDEPVYQDKRTSAQTRYVELAVTQQIQYLSWERITSIADERGDAGGWYVSERGKNKGEVFFLADLGERLSGDGRTVRRGVLYGIKENGHRYVDNVDELQAGRAWRHVGGHYQEVALTRAVDAGTAEALWREQLARAPKTETTASSMLVGVILPIWDRVAGSETIYRLQTDDGEQLLGRLLGPGEAKQTLKNLGIDSTVAMRSPSDLFSAITRGDQAVLANGWDIQLAKINYENRIEVRATASFTEAEKRLLQDQGAFIERINWRERVFIPSEERGLAIFERITASKPVVDLVERGRDSGVQDADLEGDTETEAHHRRSDTMPTESGETLSVPRAKQLILEFCRSYPEVAELDYYVRPTQEDLYGPEATREAVGLLQAGIIPAYYDAQGQFHRAEAHFATSNFRDENEFASGLRHELLGHFGVNTYSPEEKRAVLNAIIDAREQESIKDLWRLVDKQYPNDSESRKAEEVFAFVCEDIEPTTVANKEEAEKALREACFERTRSLHIADLREMTAMVAAGLRDGTRTLQTFPDTPTQQFKMETDQGGARKPFHELVAETLIEQLKAGTAPWQKPWNAAEAYEAMPFNPVTAKRYHGVNAMFLMAQERGDNRWMTYKQAASLGAQVRKGEKGTPVQYWKFSDERPKLDASSKLLRNAEGKPITETIQLERPRVFFASVFNGEQIDGLPKIERGEPTWNPIERADTILKNSGATITHQHGDRAYYKSSADAIVLPGSEQFDTAQKYYATALHELGHWTGHHSRLGRDLSHPFGSEGYAKEELRAEIASLMVGSELGVGHDPGQHASYVSSWIKALNDDPLEIFRAAADAEKIHSFVLALEQKQVQTTVATTSIDNTILPEDRQAAEDLAMPLTAENEPHQATLGQSVASTVQRQGVTPAFAAHVNSVAPSRLAATAEAESTKRGTEQLQPKHDALESPQARARASLEEQYVINGNKYCFRQTPTRVAFREEAKRLTTEYNSAEVIRGMVDAAQAKGWQALQLNGTEEFRRQVWLEATLRDMDTRGYEPTAQDHRAIDDTLAVRIAQQDVLEKWNWQRNVEQARESEAISTEATRADDADRRAIERAGVTQEFNQAAEDLAMQHTTDNAPHQATLEQKLTSTLQFSTLTPGDYRPSSEVRSGMHAAVFVGADAAILCGPSEDPKSIALAEALATSAEFERVARVAKLQGDIVIGVVNGEHIKWHEVEAAVVDKSSGQVEHGEEDGPLVTVVVNDPRRAIATKVCSTTSLARIFDAQVPVLETLTPRSTAEPRTAEQVTWLALPFGEKDAAKTLAGRLPNGEKAIDWDQVAKSWYAKPGADLSKLTRWLPDARRQEPGILPREEFSDALRSLGCIISGEHPIMDGQKHRIMTEGDKRGEPAGFYVGHLDGHPAGYIKNNRSGVEIRWKSKGYSLDPAAKAALQAEAASKLAERTAAQARAQERAAKRVQQQSSELQSPTQPTPYVTDKGITLHAGTFTDREATTTYIPAFDVDGKQWTMQYVQADGTKRFAKDSRKEGCFHVVGGQDKLASAPAIVIAEGYATAATITEAIGMPAVAAFDSGNVPAVAKALHERFPDKPIVIAGDDDAHLVAKLGVNPGRSKAEDAAKSVGGVTVFPIFAPSERAERPKDFTDFNDLATRSVLGKDSVSRQVKPVVTRAIDTRKATLAQQQTEERVRRQEREPRAIRR